MKNMIADGYADRRTLERRIRRWRPSPSAWAAFQQSRSMPPTWA
jgi:aconitase B